MRTYFSRLICAASLTLLGCNQPSGDDLPEWSPSDHDNQQNPSAAQVDTSKPRPGMPSLEQHGVTDVVLATWKQNCIQCHGVIGRGDGPQGKMLKPPDMTSAAWQKRSIDSELEYAIRKGRGRMPAFGHLPESTVKGLVSLIRLLNSERTAEGAPKPAAPSQPAPSQPAPSQPAPEEPAAQ